MTEIHQFKSALDTFEYTNGVYNHTIAPGIWTYIDVDELNFEHLVDIVSKTHGIKIYVANQENFFKKFEIEIGANLGSIVSVEDSLASSSTTSALSAAQGKALHDALADKLDTSAYVQHYRGKYTTLLALQTAIATGVDGDYAIVDTGTGNDAVYYIWDAQDGWVSGGSTTASTTDTVTEGSTNLYFTSERVRDTLLSGLSLVTNAAISASDSVLGALGKLQKQVTDILTNQRYVFVTDPNTTYTVPASAVTANGNTIIELSNNSLTSITVNPSTATGKTAGDSVTIHITGTYAAQLLVASGVTLNGTLAFSANAKIKTLIYRGSNTWTVLGG